MWLKAAEHAQRLGVRIDAYRFGVELRSVNGAAVHGIGRDGALLVRPDEVCGLAHTRRVRTSRSGLEEVGACQLSYLDVGPNERVWG